MAEVKRFVTPVFRLSFPALFAARSYDGKDAKYGCSAVWTPSEFNDQDKKLWKAILRALDAESKSCFNKAFKDLPANFKRGIRDGAEKSDLEGYGEGTKFASLTTQMRPGVIDRSKNVISPEEGNGEMIYPGCYCRATVNVYSYNNKGKGVALGLMNLQFIKDGDRLDSRTDAAEDFEDDLDDWDGDGDDDDFLE